MHQELADRIGAQTGNTLSDKLRPKQRAPETPWLIWIIRAGRGFGKTLAGAYWTLQQSEHVPYLAIVAATYGDGRDYCIEGESGLQALNPDVQFNRSLGEIRFPSGCRGKLFSAEEPERLRGPNAYAAWCDEFGSWRYQGDAWKALVFMVRRGEGRITITTTPKPSKLFAELEARPTTYVTRGSSRENLENLSASFIANAIAPYEGTRLGQQEIEGEILQDAEGSLWKRDQIAQYRVAKPPEFRRVVVSVDPAVTSNEESNETGICVSAKGADNHGYVLEGIGMRGTPLQWATQAIAFVNKYDADAIVYETNQGGDMVTHTIKTTLDKIDPGARIRLIGVRASRGKVARAQPIATMYEQGQVHHVGIIPALEDQLCQWVEGDDSPDILDACVWGLTDLFPNRGRIHAMSV